MARIFITGSADGLGQLAARLLIDQGHAVVMHARNDERANAAIEKTLGAEAILTGDLSMLAEVKDLAHKANGIGTFDAVIHNAGVYQTSAKQIFAVNVVAPYVLTSLMNKPKRLVYLSSSMHLSGRPNLDNITANIERLSYSDSKLHIMMLTSALAQRWPDVYVNAVDPGWVPTKMGGKGAPDDLQQGCETQAWLATSNHPQAKVTGRYFYHQQQRRHNTAADDGPLQEKLIALLNHITGVALP